MHHQVLHMHELTLMDFYLVPLEHHRSALRCHSLLSNIFLKVSQVGCPIHLESEEEELDIRQQKSCYLQLGIRRFNYHVIY